MKYFEKNLPSGQVFRQMSICQLHSQYILQVSTMKRYYTQQLLFFAPPFIKQPFVESEYQHVNVTACADANRSNTSEKHINAEIIFFITLTSQFLSFFCQDSNSYIAVYSGASISIMLFNLEGIPSSPLFLKKR